MNLYHHDATIAAESVVSLVLEDYTSGYPDDVMTRINICNNIQAKQVFDALRRAGRRTIKMSQRGERVATAVQLECDPSKDCWLVRFDNPKAQRRFFRVTYKEVLGTYAVDDL